MKHVLAVLIIIVCVVPVNAEKGHPLPDIMKPKNIVVNENRLYVSDEYRIFVYSLDDFRLLHRVGKKGKGPGEFSFTPSLYFYKDKLRAMGGGKIIIYSKEMNVIQEKKMMFFASRIRPFGNNYLMVHDEEDKKSRFSTVSVFDTDFKKIKTLAHGKKWEKERKSNENDPVVLVGPIFRALCSGDKAYIADGRKGFHIEIYDLEGNRIKEIIKNVKPVKTGESQKRNRLNEVRRAPVIIKRWEQLKNRIAFPEYLPLMRDIHLGEKNLFVKTWGIKDGREEYMVFDLDGNEITAIYLPAAMRFNYTFAGNTFYYIKENEETGEWELYCEKRIVPVDTDTDK